MPRTNPGMKMNTVNDLRHALDLETVIDQIGKAGIPAAMRARAAERHPAGTEDRQCVAIDHEGGELWVVGLTTDVPAFEVS